MSVLALHMVLAHGLTRRNPLRQVLPALSRTPRPIVWWKLMVVRPTPVYESPKLSRSSGSTLLGTSVLRISLELPPPVTRALPSEPWAVGAGGGCACRAVVVVAGLWAGCWWSRSCGGRLRVNGWAVCGAVAGVVVSIVAAVVSPCDSCGCAV